MCPYRRQTRVMRRLVAIAIVVLLLAGGPAAASCVALSPAEKVAMADVVASGRVDRGILPSRTVTFRPATVFKGDLATEVSVRIGPDVGATGATSVDYDATAGQHVLYLRSVSGAYETNDCSGSHAGAPTNEEQAIFGAGVPPHPISLGGDVAAFGLVLLVAAAAAAIAAGALFLRAKLVRRAQRGA